MESQTDSEKEYSSYVYITSSDWAWLAASAMHDNELNTFEN